MAIGIVELLAKGEDAGSASFSVFLNQPITLCVVCDVKLPDGVELGVYANPAAGTASGDWSFEAVPCLIGKLSAQNPTMMIVAIGDYIVRRPDVSELNLQVGVGLWSD